MIAHDCIISCNVISTNSTIYFTAQTIRKLSICGIAKKIKGLDKLYPKTY